jgi:pimeloyl-ACP methyl ester carboxylesterase
MPTQSPIVLLPGVMGSRLYFPRSRRFWDPDRPLRMARWAPVWLVRSDDDNRKDLHSREPAGVVLDTKDVTPDQRDHGWSTVIWSFYGGMLERLARETGSEVFAAGYDWRQDIRALGRYAAGKLRQVLKRTGAERIAVVTHSMGGLVTRAGLHPEIGSDLEGRVGPVIHICQPSAGAVVLYRRLFTGLVRGLDGGGGLQDRAFRLLLGNNRQAFLGNMSGLPGPMQLLPTSHFPPESGGRWNSFLDSPGATHAGMYSHANSPPGLVPHNLNLSTEVLADLGARVGDLAALEQFLNAVPPATGDTWLIYGVGLTTEVQIQSGSEQTPVRIPVGDEVVPAISAIALGLPSGRMIAVEKLAHPDACQDQRVQDEVLTILAGAPVGRRAGARAAGPIPFGNGRVEVADWLRSSGAIAGQLGARVRVTIEFDPPEVDCPPPRGQPRSPR